MLIVLHILSWSIQRNKTVERLHKDSSSSTATIFDGKLHLFYTEQNKMMIPPSMNVNQFERKS